MTKVIDITKFATPARSFLISDQGFILMNVTSQHSVGALTCFSRIAALFEALAFSFPTELQTNLSLRLCESDESTQLLLTPVNK